MMFALCSITAGAATPLQTAPRTQGDKPWDAIGSEFGGRHELYEVNWSGSHEEIRRFALLGAVASGQYERWKSFADSCMAEHDLDGWTVSDLVNPDDVSVLG